MQNLVQKCRELVPFFLRHCHRVMIFYFSAAVMCATFSVHTSGAKSGASAQHCKIHWFHFVNAYIKLLTPRLPILRLTSSVLSVDNFGLVLRCLSSPCRRKELFWAFLRFGWSPKPMMVA